MLAKKMDSRAAQSFSTAVAINPDYYLGHLGLGLIQKKQARIAQAKQNLLNSKQLLPTQTAVYHLGEIELAQGNRETAVNYFRSATQQGGELGERARAQLQTLQTAPADTDKPEGRY